MNLSLHRFVVQSDRTIGNLILNDDWFCYTLEDAVRPEKIYGKTAIPAGKYQIKLRNSPKFGTDVLWLQDVPNFEYIYIHAGNTEKDTLGCILVGQMLVDLDASNPGPEAIGRSRVALNALREKVVPEIKRGQDVWIDIG